MAVVIGLYLTILVVNLGGYIDKIFEGLINESIGGMIYGGWLKDTPEPERTAIIDQTRQAMRAAQGLDEPFFQRSLLRLWQGLTLNLGETFVSYNLVTFEGSVEGIVMKHLPYTLVLVGLTNLFIFVTAVFASLVLSRHPGSIQERMIMILSSLTSAPAWIFGLILIVVLAGKAFFFPYPKIIDSQLIRPTYEHLTFLLRQMTLPVLAIFLSTFFIGLYTWRSFFLIFSQEDYVDVARAKGLPPRKLENSYILRPVLPYVITSFALMLLGLWQGAIALELLFLWPGVGTLFVTALRTLNISILLGVVIIFAYLLALTVFLLDIVYLFIDPRVRVGGSGITTRQIKRSRSRRWGLFSRRGEQIKPIIRAPEQPELAPETENETAIVRKKKVRLSLGETNPALGEIFHSPLAVTGLLLIGLLIVVAIATIVFIPYDEAVRLWRAGNEGASGSTWYRNPEYALPAWVNLFRKEKLPETIVLDSRAEEVEKAKRIISENTNEISFAYTFDFNYDQFPQDLVLNLQAKYDQKLPLLTLKWLTPDGREFDLGSFSIKSAEAYYLSRDKRLQRKLGNPDILQALFAQPDSTPAVPLKGSYELLVSAFTFEPQASVDGEFILFGKVHGLAGTDNQRRDLMLGMLWGLPVALVFGLLGAVVTSLIAMLIAATGAWFGGWVDDIIQRITEINMILPSLLIAILVSVLYSKSIWTILGILVLLSIFGSGIKNYRSVFLQIKQAPYLEAARAYGVGNWRIIWRYIVPTILPVLIPQLIIMVPLFVFYEATLAYLGVSDPNLPTWGKIIYEALISGSFREHYYWFLEPIAMLLLTSLGFLLLGFSLERILNPRLRSF